MRTNRGTWERHGTPKATTSPGTSDLAWAAGFYEGEGTCQPSNGSFGHSQTVKVQQNHKEPLQRLQQWFGGSITESRSRGFSTKQIFIWIICGARARGFLYTIYSFLSARRRLQARVALGV